MKILDPFDSMIWIIFFIWSIFTTLSVINVILQNCNDITKQIHESFILCIYNYFTYFFIIFFAFFVFDMAPPPKNSSQNVKHIYDTINKFCGGCGVFINLLVLKQYCLKYTIPIYQYPTSRKKEEIMIINSNMMFDSDILFLLICLKCCANQLKTTEVTYTSKNDVCLPSSIQYVVCTFL